MTDYPHVRKATKLRDTPLAERNHLEALIARAAKETETAYHLAATYEIGDAKEAIGLALTSLRSAADEARKLDP